mmetsp:Transcript_6939/g.17010  ORF Transcript_6939/g.17010 Transcript_6939/m.17010 type:complete len:254 (-) Transcript_6939:95-856(-)
MDERRPRPPPPPPPPPPSVRGPPMNGSWRWAYRSRTTRASAASSGVSVDKNCSSAVSRISSLSSGSRLARNDAESISSASACAWACCSSCRREDSCSRTSARISGGRAAKNSSLIELDGAAPSAPPVELRPPVGGADSCSMCVAKTSARSSSGRAAKNVGSMPVLLVADSMMFWSVVAGPSTESLEGSACASAGSFWDSCGGCGSRVSAGAFSGAGAAVEGSIGAVASRGTMPCITADSETFERKAFMAEAIS